LEISRVLAVTWILEKTMRLRLYLSIPVAVLPLAAAALLAQDTRKVTEPVIPPACAVIHAPLRSTPRGPIVGSSLAEQDAESRAETNAIERAIRSCKDGRAVELALDFNPSFNAFLINPIDLPPGISLIVDGGVTVYGSRDPEKYQMAGSDGVCGTIGPYKVDQGCNPLINLTSNSGIYGYGIIDGQGNRTLLSGENAPRHSTWWDLTSYKNRPVSGSGPKVPDTCDGQGQPACLQASPEVIHAGDDPSDPIPTNCDHGSSEPNCNLTLYKITIRNPPYHTVKLGGKNVTVWGAKVQAPWNLPNTDGFDIHASNVTVYDTTVANGDQELVFGSTDGPSANITVDHFRGYNKGGITILANGSGTSELLVRNVNITGDLPSVAGTTVNGMTDAEMKRRYKLASYGQALPNSTNDLKALQISDASSSASQMSNIRFESVCIQDIVKPIDFDLTPGFPQLESLVLKDIHVLAPSAQFPEFSTTEKGVPTGAHGAYQLTFVTENPAAFASQITLDNVVFDDSPDAPPSIASIEAEGNAFSTVTNVYPSVFNRLDHGYVADPKAAKDQESGVLLTLSDNTVDPTTSTSDPSLAYACRTDALPFTVGDLFINTSRARNLQTASVAAGDAVVLNAVVQPAMSQTTHFIPGSYGASPGLLAVGSPALSNPVVFYEGGRLIGVGALSANGTLATLVVRDIPPGVHRYTAQYPADRYYRTLNFGAVTVTATRSH
jgi:polygalacturonase